MFNVTKHTFLTCLGVYRFPGSTFQGLTHEISDVYYGPSSMEVRKFSGVSLRLDIATPES